MPGSVPVAFCLRRYRNGSGSAESAHPSICRPVPRWGPCCLIPYVLQVSYVSQRPFPYCGTLGDRHSAWIAPCRGLALLKRKTKGRHPKHTRAIYRKSSTYAHSRACDVSVCSSILYAPLVAIAGPAALVVVSSSRRAETCCWTKLLAGDS